MGRCCSKSSPIPTVSVAINKTNGILQNKTENLEDLTVVWFDADIRKPNNDHRQVRLRSIINYLKTFDNPNQCLDYILSVKNEKVFLIVSGSLGENIVPQIYQLPQVAFIYVFCRDKLKHEKWANTYVKQIRGVFTDEQLLLSKVNADVSLFSKSLIQTSIFGNSTKEKSIQDLKTEGTMYMWLQLLIDILLRIPRTIDARGDMLKICRSQYVGNDIEQKNINDFESSYSLNDAVLWYTRDTFVYRLLNKAFRTEDIELLFQFRFFIVDLYEQLKRLHAEFVILQSEGHIITVYRGQLMVTDELNKLHQNIGGLILFNTFVSTTTDLSIAIIYSGEGGSRPLFESVVFQMDIDKTSSAEKPFANIEKLSAIEDEKEVLLSMGSIFLIESVEFRNNYWHIKLTLCDEQNEKLKSLATHYKRKIGQTPTVVTLADHLWSMGEYDKAERFYLMLLTHLSDNHELMPFVHHGLGLVHLDKGNYSSALSYLNKGLKLRLLTLSPNHSDIAQSYNDIAEVYRSEGDYEEALNLHQKALDIRQTASATNQSDLVETYNNMGLLHDFREELSDALNNYSKAIDIGLKILPDNHPQLAVVYLNIGNTYRKLEDYQHALKYREQALNIFLQSLPSNHTEVSNTYLGIGSVYLYEQEYEKALAYYEKSLEIDRQMLQPDHPDLALTYHNIGHVYLKMEKAEKAMECFQETLEIQNIALPKFHPHLGETYSSIGIVHEKNSDYKKALQYHEKALETASHSLPSTHKTILKFKSRMEKMKEKLML